MIMKKFICDNTNCLARPGPVITKDIDDPPCCDTCHRRMRVLPESSQGKLADQHFVQVTHTVQTDKLRVQDDTYYKVTITVHYKYANTTEFHPHHIKYVKKQTERLIQRGKGTQSDDGITSIVLSSTGKVLDGVHRLNKGE